MPSAGLRPNKMWGTKTAIPNSKF